MQHLTLAVALLAGAGCATAHGGTRSAAITDMIRHGRAAAAANSTSTKPVSADPPAYVPLGTFSTGAYVVTETGADLTISGGCANYKVNYDNAGGALVQVRCALGYADSTGSVNTQMVTSLNNGINSYTITGDVDELACQYTVNDDDDDDSSMAFDAPAGPTYFGTGFIGLQLADMFVWTNSDGDIWMTQYQSSMDGKAIGQALVFGDGSISVVEYGQANFDADPSFTKGEFDLPVSISDCPQATTGKAQQHRPVERALKYMHRQY